MQNAEVARSAVAARSALVLARDRGGEPSGRPGRCFWSFARATRRRRGVPLDPIVSKESASISLLLGGCPVRRGTLGDDSPVVMVTQ